MRDEESDAIITPSGIKRDKKWSKYKKKVIYCVYIVNKRYERVYVYTYVCNDSYTHLVGINRKVAYPILYSLSFKRALIICVIVIYIHTSMFKWQKE